MYKETNLKTILILLLFISIYSCNNSEREAYSHKNSYNLKKELKYIGNKSYNFIDKHNNKYLINNTPDSLLYLEEYLIELTVFTDVPNFNEKIIHCQINKITLSDRNEFSLCQIGETVLYTGGQKDLSSDTQLTFGVELKRIGKSEFEYKWTTLKNWVQESEIIGNAIISNETNKCPISTNNVREACYSLIDLINKKSMFITKSNVLNESRLRMLNKKTNECSVVLFHK